MRHWWQDWRWAATTAVVLLALAGFANAAASWRGADKLGSNTAVVNQLKAITDDNRQTLDRLDRNQTGIDALVSFVNDIKARPSDPQTQAALSAAINTERILCASPQFTEQCRAAGVPVG